MFSRLRKASVSNSSTSPTESLVGGMQLHAEYCSASNERKENKGPKFGPAVEGSKIFCDKDHKVTSIPPFMSWLLYYSFTSARAHPQFPAELGEDVWTLWVRVACAAEGVSW
ncbi:hypothetical protein CYMTET_29160 [Cymbomonas tetramitiformis]|uniref:Uncharacterized protein n=1 Tax=Cymbomonas tetramitiformis TaxID=36881 RepID=A0AAE0KVF2_9CHLO|nr:hypothetical protein CYMTET_29160 [Cymbomonas tetramitiformis]